MGLEGDGCVRSWLGRLGSGAYVAFTYFRCFYEETLCKDSVLGGLSPSGLVEWQVGSVGRDRFRILSLAQSWINDRGLRHGSKKAVLSYIRSFFLHNRAELPEDRSFRFRADVPPVEGRLDFESFRRILHNCNKMYRAVFLMMAQGLMGESELVYVSSNLWREVLQHLTKNDGFFRVGLPGRKRNRNVKNYYAILCTKSDWAEAYREYLKSCARSISGCLFRNNRGEPLQRHNIQHYFHDRAVEAGLIKPVTPNCERCDAETVKVRAGSKIGYKCKECGHTMLAAGLVPASLRTARYGVNPHEIRDLMRSRWRESGADPAVAEFMMQHEIDKNHYDKMEYTPGYALEEYRKALPWLNVVSEDPTKVDRSSVDAELETYRNQSQILSREVAHLSQYVQTLESRLKERVERTKLEDEALALLNNPALLEKLKKLLKMEGK